LLPTDADPRTALRDWVRGKAEPGLTPAGEELDGVALFKQRVLTSLHLPELILLIERLRSAPVDVGSLKAEQVASIDAIVAEFFATEAMG
jgi:hypothetical protein